MSNDHCWTFFHQVTNGRENRRAWLFSGEQESSNEGWRVSNGVTYATRNGPAEEEEGKARPNSCALRIQPLCGRVARATPILLTLPSPFYVYARVIILVSAIRGGGGSASSQITHRLELVFTRERKCIQI